MALSCRTIVRRYGTSASISGEHRAMHTCRFLGHGRGGHATERWLAYSCKAIVWNSTRATVTKVRQMDVAVHVVFVVNPPLVVMEDVVFGG